MGRWQKQISKTFVDKKECNSIWLFVYWATEHIELVDNMNQTQDDKYILSLICFARKDFSEQYLMEDIAWNVILLWEFHLKQNI